MPSNRYFFRTYTFIFIHHNSIIITNLILLTHSWYFFILFQQNTVILFNISSLIDKNFNPFQIIYLFSQTLSILDILEFIQFLNYFFDYYCLVSKLYCYCFIILYWLCDLVYFWGFIYAIFGRFLRV